MTVPGLEDIAAGELRAAGATITSMLTRIDKRDGMVLFRVADIATVLRCGTIEDLFQVVLDAPTGGGRNAPRRLARALDRATFDRALAQHHALRPGKRGRSFRVVARVSGEQPFRRDEVEAAFTSALDGMLGRWVPANENPALELWVHVIGDRTVAGVRLSDDTLAGRAYKRAHLPASLKPTVARALAIIAGVGPSDVILDPMCGAGTILREAAEQATAGSKRWRGGMVFGGDVEANAVAVARRNAGKLSRLAVWDARRLPLRNGMADVVITNPPYGRQHEAWGDVGALYKQVAREIGRILAPDGRAVILTGEAAALLEALPRILKVRAKRRLLLRGLPVTAFVIVRV